jgi:hypothetical protein
VAKGALKQQLYQEWGHIAHRGWARFLLDRREGLIVLPRFGGHAAGAGGLGQVSPEEDLAGLLHQHRNSDPHKKKATPPPHPLKIRFPFILTSSLRTALGQHYLTYFCLSAQNYVPRGVFSRVECLYLRLLWHTRAHPLKPTALAFVSHGLVSARIRVHKPIVNNSRALGWVGSHKRRCASAPF